MIKTSWRICICVLNLILKPNNIIFILSMYDTRSGFLQAPNALDPDLAMVARPGQQWRGAELAPPYLHVEIGHNLKLNAQIKQGTA